MRRERLLYGLLVLPSIILVGAAVVLPTALSLVQSFQNEGRWTYENYLSFLLEPPYPQVLGATIVIALVVTAICMALGFPLAAFLATQDGRAAAVALGLITASLWISILVKVYSWQVLLAKAGPINALLRSVGITSAPIPFLYTRGAVVIGMVQFMLPYAIMLLYAGMRRVDWELIVVARTLGAGLPTVFRQVYWPQVSFTVITAAVIVFVIATSFFVAPALLGGPGETMLGMQMKSDLVNRYDSGMAATSGVALTLILLAITWGAVRLTGMSFRRLASEVVR